MLDQKLFEYAKIHCANDYIMAAETRPAEACLEYIKTTNLRIDNIVFKPKTSQVRFVFLPSRAFANRSEVFNVNNPDTAFLRPFWDLGLPELQAALTEYMVQSNIKHKYETLDEAEKTWLTSVILGAKE